MHIEPTVRYWGRSMLWYFFGAIILMYFVNAFWAAVVSLPILVYEVAPVDLHAEGGAGIAI
jgi:hypothetical protein